jgi:hypothetical protein
MSVNAGCPAWPDVTANVSPTSGSNVLMEMPLNALRFSGSKAASFAPETACARTAGMDVPANRDREAPCTKRRRVRDILFLQDRFGGDLVSGMFRGATTPDVAIPGNAEQR